MDLRTCLVYFVVHVSIVQWYLLGVNCDDKEPRCSKFEFEEKVLEKLVYIDHDIRASVKDVQNRITKLESETETKLSEYEKERLEFMSDIKTLLLNTNTTLYDDIDNFKAAVNDTIKHQIETNEINVKADREYLNNMADGINAAVTETKEMMENKTTALREAVMGEQVVFIARFPTNRDPSAGETIIFGTVIANHGNAYDPSNGHFTAPLPGVYLFTVQICIDGESTINYQIRSRDTIYSATEYMEGVDDICSSVTAVAVLKKDEEIWVKCIERDSGDYVIEPDDGDKFWTMFSGVRVN